MRKFTLALYLLFSVPVFSFAQTTITDNDMPSVGYMLIESNVNDTALFSVDVSATGANYSWNFCHLQADSQLVDTFISVGSTPIAYQLFFNNAFLYPDHEASYAKRGRNMEFSQSGLGVSITDVYDYFKNDPADYKQVGFGANINGIPASIQYDGIDHIYRFPLDYGNIDSSDAAFVLEVPSLGYYGQKIKRINEVDGWGEVTTPLGTYQTVRVKTQLDITDTIYVNQIMFGTTIPRPTEYVYTWLAAGESTPVMTITTREVVGSEVIESASFKDMLGISQPCVANLVESNGESGLVLYPNPTSDFVIIDGAENYQEYFIVDHLGKNVQVGTIDNRSINVTSLSSGVYFLCYQGKFNKFEVIK